MSIAAPAKTSCSTTHFRYEKSFFYKIRCRVLEQRACFYSGAPNEFMAEILLSNHDTANVS